jgi:hypothetical protein
MTDPVSTIAGTATAALSLASAIVVAATPPPEVRIGRWEDATAARFRRRAVRFRAVLRRAQRDGTIDELGELRAWDRAVSLHEELVHLAASRGWDVPELPPSEV